MPAEEELWLDFEPELEPEPELELELSLCEDGEPEDEEELPLDGEPEGNPPPEEEGLREGGCDAGKLHPTANRTAVPTTAPLTASQWFMFMAPVHVDAAGVAGLDGKPWRKFPRLSQANLVPR